jgi:hypothetical protein
MNKESFDNIKTQRHKIHKKFNRFQKFFDKTIEIIFLELIKLL